MLPVARVCPHDFTRPPPSAALGLALALASMLATPAPARAQSADSPPVPAASATPSATPAPDTSDTPVGFEADRVDYNDTTDVLTATGKVVLRRADDTLHADSVVWNRKTGDIVASGHVHLIDANGNVTFAQTLHLTDSFTTGTLDTVLLVLREGGRVAATRGSRDAQGYLHLAHAAYTACDVVDARGCPARPSWRITARRIVYSPTEHTLRLYGARLVLLGLVRIPLPRLQVATDGRAVSGLLIPDATTSTTNGFGYDQTYYARLSPNRDLALTGYVYTAVQPMLSARYRALGSGGAYQVTGYLTQSEVISGANVSGVGQSQPRGYLDSNGRFQLSPAWSIDYSGRLASDRTFLSRYYLSSDDVLRSNITVARHDDASYLSIAGWAFETLRTGESQGQVPIALPEIDYRRRLTDPLLGGTITLDANSLAISRTAGQDTQRALASATWSLARITGLGQVVTLTGLTRVDAYHATDLTLDGANPYEGQPGWHTRGQVLGAIDVTWPLVGAALGGTQVLTPHVQLVASPPVANAAIPNEDAQAIELADDTIFALNRFPGYDRIEDGSRLTYGADWALDRPRWHLDGTLAQSYRFSGTNALFSVGSGLSGQVSDIVSRIDIRYRDFLALSSRLRIDKGDFALHRNEIDATLGSNETYVELGYTRVNQTSPADIDTQGSNELRGASRVAFARYWSLFGSGVFDLARDTLVGGGTAKPFQPLRTRLGFAFLSDCFEFDLTWRNDYVTIGDAAKGSSFMVHIALRNIGLR